MSNVYLGQIVMFAGNFAPRGFAFCNGQLLSIAQNTALFSLLGTYYGGNGTTTFALPNLQSRISLHQGQGPGLAYYAIGQSAGAPNVTILTTTMPSHPHVLNATTPQATANTIGNTLLPAQPTASLSGNPTFYIHPVQGQPAPVQHTLAAAACGPNGGSQPHSNLMPTLCITFIIALQGIFPSRN
jgi:microcystin-dependent protein